MINVSENVIGELSNEKESNPDFLHLLILKMNEINENLNMLLFIYKKTISIIDSIINFY